MPTHHKTCHRAGTACQLSTLDLRSGHSTTYTSPAPRVTNITGPDGSVTQHLFDDQGRLKTSTNALGFSTIWTLDDANRFTRITDTLGQDRLYQYDVSGNLTGISIGD